VKRPLPPSHEFGLGFKLLQKGEVHCTVINLSVTCLSLVVLSVFQANYSLRHDISKRLSLQIKYCRNPEMHFVCSIISIADDVCDFCFVFYGVFFVFVFGFCFVIVVLFMFLIYQEQGNDLSLKKTMVYLEITPLSIETYLSY